MILVPLKQPMKENHGRWTAINILVLLLLQFSQSFGSPPPTSADFQYESKHKVILILMVILVCLMSIFFATACFSIYLHQRGGGRQMPRNFNLTEDGSLTEERLDPDVLNAFPTFIYLEVKGLKIGKGALECAVCLNEFEDDDTLRLLPNCSHVFHCDCIDVWLSSNITCPVCRANVSHSPFPLLTHDLGTEASRDCRNQNSDPVTDELIITIQSPDIIQSAIPTNSTSGSVVKPAEDCDRFKLRLPEEVRSRLVRTSLSRTKSSVALPRAMSLRNGYRSSSVGTGRGNKNFFHNERPDKCEFTGQPQSLSRPTSVRRPKVNGGGSGGEGGGRVRVGGGGGGGDVG